MHAYKKTMQRRLGIADTDRNDPIHDLACQYLASEQVIPRLAKAVGVTHAFRFEQKVHWDYEYSATVQRELAGHAAWVEHEISKGYGQYQTTIGFADLVVQFHIRSTLTKLQERRKPNFSADHWGAWTTHEDMVEQYHAYRGIEVKVSQVRLGELIRQIKLYRSYCDVDKWIAATTYPLTQAERECLCGEGIDHVRLGEAFDAYVATQRSNAPAASPEL